MASSQQTSPLAYLQRRGAAVGLAPNLAKCEVIAVGRLDPSSLVLAYLLSFFVGQMVFAGKVEPCCAETRGMEECKVSHAV